MRSAICFTNLLLTSCVTLKTTVDTSDTSDTGQIPTTSIGVEFLGIEGSMHGWWSERMGTDLAFLADSRLLIGAPSHVHGEPSDQEDDLCWIAERREGMISTRSGDEVGALALDDSWEDPEMSPAAGNHFGLGVIAPGDLTGDGVEDVAVGEEPNEDTLQLQWGVFPGPDFTAGFALPAQLGSGRGVSCGDLDGDEVAELCTSDGVFFGPLSEESLYGVHWATQDPFVTSADLDADGVNEIVVSDASASAVYHLAALSRAGEVVLSAIAADAWSASNGSATALAVGDLDGDGAKDIIAGWSGQGDDVVLVGLPAGGGDPFSARSTLPVRGEDLAVGDFDGDGQDDLAVGGASEVTIWLGPLTAGTLSIEAVAARYRGPQFPSDQLGHVLSAADTDGDGRSELAIGAPFENTPGDSCEEQGGTCMVAGRVWWLLGGGL